MLGLEEWMDIKALFNAGYAQRAIAELTGSKRLLTTKTTSDQVCEEYAKAGVKLTLKLLGNDKKFVLIEGDSEALECLGRLLLSVAKVDLSCSRPPSPNAPGVFFY